MSKRKRFNLFNILFIMITTAFLSTLCGGSATKAGEGPGYGYKEVTLSGKFKGGMSYKYYPIYFNMRTGEQVSESEKNSKNWDIMIKGAYFYTNSGSSASVEYGTGSLGEGGWYFSGLEGTESLTHLTLADVNDELFEEDYRAYINENPFNKGEVNCNGMLLLTTEKGSGTKEDPYRYFSSMTDESVIRDTSDDEAIVWMSGIPPKYYSTNRIYFIRCADGMNFGKLMFGSLSQSRYFFDCEYKVSFYCQMVSAR